MAEEKTEMQVQQAIIEILQDCIEHNKKIVKRQSAIIILLICLLFGSFCYYVYSMNQYDYEDINKVVTEANTDNNSKITNSDSANAQNNININVPKK